MSKPHPSLKAMAEDQHVAGVSKITTFSVDPDLVEFEEGFNLREEGPELAEHLERMYIAMKAGASFPPIDVTVRDGRILARDGHCRTRTARRLKAEGIQIKLEARHFRGNDADAIFLMVGSDQGMKFSPLQQGRGFLRLIRMNFTVQQIANQSGFHRSTIETGLKLAEAPVAIQKMITDKQVSAEVALDMMETHGSKAEERLQAAISKLGGKKVTRKHVSPPSVPRKAVQTFVSSTAALRSYFADNPKEAKALEKGGTVMVPAALLKSYLDAMPAQPVNEEDEL